ncbi:hypothetical protein [Treponema putidum]|uniref:hypothetical protein n=1 Tax=Treponema putidum TaxID=221027 RepID=UPI0021055B46|nr:hypothetical protein [Treponema putidum]UTY30823.1 hypothetical protein E4N75_04160 [Treponema putidum]
MLIIIITKVNNNFIEKPSKKGSWVTFFIDFLQNLSRHSPHDLNHIYATVCSLVEQVDVQLREQPSIQLGKHLFPSLKVSNIDKKQNLSLGYASFPYKRSISLIPDS